MVQVHLRDTPLLPCFSADGRYGCSCRIQRRAGGAAGVRAGAANPKWTLADVTRANETATTARVVPLIDGRRMKAPEAVYVCNGSNRGCVLAAPPPHERADGQVRDVPCSGRVQVRRRETENWCNRRKRPVRFFSPPMLLMSARASFCFLAMDMCARRAAGGKEDLGRNFASRPCHRLRSAGKDHNAWRDSDGSCRLGTVWLLALDLGARR